MCVVPPIKSAGWDGGTRGGGPAAQQIWTLYATADGHKSVLASGRGVSCEAGTFIDMSVAVVLPDEPSVPPIVIARAGGKELARMPAPPWGFRSGAASIACSIGIAEFDDIVIEKSKPMSPLLKADDELAAVSRLLSYRPEMELSPEHDSMRLQTC